MTDVSRSDRAKPARLAQPGWQRSLGRWLDRHQPSEPVVLVVTSLLVGVGAGLAAIAFRWLIDLVGQVAFGWLPAGLDRLASLPLDLHLVLAPALGVPWIVDYRDPWTAGGQKPHHVRSRFSDAVEIRTERRCLARAARAVAASQAVQ